MCVAFYRGADGLVIVYDVNKATTVAALGKSLGLSTHRVAKWKNHFFHQTQIQATDLPIFV